MVKYAEGEPSVKLGEERAELRTAYSAVSRPERNAVKRERSVVGGREATDEVHFYYSRCHDRFSLILLKGELISFWRGQEGSGVNCPSQMP